MAIGALSFTYGWNNDLPFLMNNVQCTGRESALTECDYDEYCEINPTSCRMAGACCTPSKCNYTNEYKYTTEYS